MEIKKMENTIHSTLINTPIGQLFACATDEGICMLEFPHRKMFTKQVKGLEELLSSKIVEGAHHLFDQLEIQLKEYFAGSRKVFEIPLLLTGTPFQKEVWTSLLQIPYGSKSTYLQLSKALGNTKAIRAVAGANGANKISIIIPCHRVIGTNGKLVGYGGGLRNKQFLLELEGKYHPSQTRLDF